MNRQKMIKNISGKKNKGFTLVEMLISLFLFAMIFTMIAGMVKFVKGNTGSDKANTPTRELRAVSDILNQKMASANIDIKWHNNTNDKINGFGVLNQILGIAIFDGGVAGGVGDRKCYFIGKSSPDINGISRLKMRVVDINSNTLNCVINQQTLNAVDNYPIDLTGNSISIDNFQLSFFTTTPQYLKVTIKAHDTKDLKNLLEWNTYYTLSYYADKRIQKY